MWAKWDAVPGPGDWMMLLTKDSIYSAYGVGYQADGSQLHFAHQRLPSQLTSLAFSPTVGTWYHLAFTFDSALNSNQSKIYVNGSLSAQATMPGTIATNSADIYLGYDSGYNAYRFKGSLDDVALYSRALSATEIQALANGGPATATITVNNVAPSNVNLSFSAGTIHEGESTTISGTFTDPGTADTFSYAWSVTKDGVPYATGNAASFSFTPDDNGTYLVGLTVTDDDGGLGTDSKTVTVLNVPPTITSLTLDSTEIREGDTVRLSSTIQDPGELDTCLLAVDWGDGSVDHVDLVPCTADLALAHRYVDDGTFSVIMTVVDDDCGTATDDRIIVVSNVPPQVGIHGPTDGVRGQPRMFTLEASDPSPTDEAAGFIFIIDWGDGSTETVSGLNGTEVEHVYTAAGSYTALVTAEDKDRGRSPLASHSMDITVVALQEQGAVLAVGGSQGNDRIQIVAAGNSEAIEVLINGTSQGTYAPTTRIVAFGQAGDDSIQVAEGVSLSAWLFGGEGNDVLRGNPGENVLVGGDGDDRLMGGQGRDLLIGGRGADRIFGQAHDDILIAGYTLHNGNLLALSDIMNGWTKNQPYEARVAALRDRLLRTHPGEDGRGPTVFDDNAEDALTGAAGQDWFFAQLDQENGRIEDKLLDLTKLELVDDLDSFSK